MNSHPNPTADPEGVGEAPIVTSRSSGRHRAAHRAPVTTVRPHLSLPQLTRSQLSAGPVAKAGAVIAVSSGLVASLGMQATAAPATPQVATAASTSCSRVKPQILMRVRKGGEEVISQTRTEDSAETLHSGRARGTGFADQQAQRPPRGASHYTK